MRDSAVDGIIVKSVKSLENGNSVVGSPMATIFILHLIDHAMRLSISCFITSKQPKAIINGSFRSWIQIYGRAQKFLSYNGGEFDNSDFIDIGETTNIVFKLTVAGTP